jgi:BASS family bile acid:Na+ symporter
MEALANSLPILVKIAISALVVALGLNASPSDVAFLWRQPRLLLRSLFAMDVVVPVAAVLLLLAIRPGREAALGILAMAISPGAPISPQKELKLGGRLPYVYSLAVAMTVFSVITIPLTMTVLHRLFAPEIESMVLPRDVAKIVTVSLLLPLGVGMAVRRFMPSVANRLAQPLATAVNAFLGLIFLLILIKAFHLIVDLGARALLAMALLTMITIAAGHLLGGPVAEDRTALAVASSLRHPGLAMMIGKVDLPQQNLTAAILAYVVIGSLAAIPYTVWRKRAAAPRGGTAHVKAT